ncbi:MAG TPA: metalloregulator ArsR/SmtB family transcription factor [Candidatus Angelobacter sp.]|jgi:DNA-binding transcriptional ArsR family regulator
MQTLASDQLSNTFAALADPTRRAILARLATGEASVTELAKPFNMSLPAVSKHLKVLEKAGLVAHGREAQWRPRRLEPNALKEVADWVEHYRQFWEQRLDRLDDYLRQIQKVKALQSETLAATEPETHPDGKSLSKISEIKEKK